MRPFHFLFYFISFTFGLLISGCRSTPDRSSHQDWVFPLPGAPSSMGSLSGLSAGLHSISFSRDQAIIPKEEERKLDDIQTRLQNYDGKLILTGFSSPSGSPEYDRQLGEQRALIVREALILRGFDPDRLMTRGFGADRSPHEPSRGKSTSRDCVEFHLPESTPSE